MRQAIVVACLLVPVVAATALFVDDGRAAREVATAAGRILGYSKPEPAPSLAPAPPGPSVTPEVIKGAEHLVAGVQSALAGGQQDKSINPLDYLPRSTLKPAAVPSFFTPAARSVDVDTRHSGAVPSDALVPVRRLVGQPESHAPTIQSDFGAATSRSLLATNPDDADVCYAMALRFRAAGDLASSASWLLTAAERGHGRAALDLAEMYRQGDGVERNNVEAFIWFDVAARNLLQSDDRLAATAARDRLAGLMTTDEMTLARAMIRDDRQEIAAAAPPLTDLAPVAGIH